VDQNLYVFDYADEVTHHIKEALNIDFSKKFMTLKEIKNILSDTKKG